MIESRTSPGFNPEELPEKKDQSSSEYEGKTGGFLAVELVAIRRLAAEELIKILLVLSPGIALRAVAEVMFNDDEEKLKQLLAAGNLTAHWRRFRTDYEYDPELDDKFADLLEKKLTSLKS